MYLATMTPVMPIEHPTKSFADRNTGQTAIRVNKLPKIPVESAQINARALPFYIRKLANMEPKIVPKDDSVFISVKFRSIVACVLQPYLAWNKNSHTFMYCPLILATMQSDMTKRKRAIYFLFGSCI